MSTLLWIVFFVTLWTFRPFKFKGVCSVFFGLPRSGKTTMAAKFTALCNRESFLLKLSRRFKFSLPPWLSKRLHHSIPVYSNVPITGSYRLDAQNDLGVFNIEDSVVIIDEAGLEFNNRQYKSFPKNCVYFFKYFGHFRMKHVFVFSQSFEDMDVTIRRVACDYYVVKKSLLPYCIVYRKIRRKIGVNKDTKKIDDVYSMGLPVLDTHRCFSPRVWHLFNTHSHEKLPVKGWSKW